MEIDVGQYIDAFLDEATDNLRHLDDMALAVENNPSDEYSLAELFRCAHTLKGMSATMGFERMSSLTHAMEDMLDKIKSRGEPNIESEVMDSIFKSLDTLQSMVDAIRTYGTDASIDSEGLVSVIKKIVDNISGTNKNDEKEKRKSSSSRIRNNIKINRLKDKQTDAGNSETLESSEFAKIENQNNHETTTESNLVVESNTTNSKRKKTKKINRKKEETVFSEYELECIEETFSLSEKFKIYQIDVQLIDACLLKYARAYILISRLEEHGLIIKSNPPMEKIENEEFDRSFTLFFMTENNFDEIQNSINCVSEIEKLDVVEIKRESILNLKKTVVVEESENKSSDIVYSERESGNKESISIENLETNNKVEKTKETVVCDVVQSKKTEKKQSNTIRVDIQRLDNLMNLVGELVIGRARIERLAQESNKKEFEEPLSRLGRISADIQEIVTKLRMVPVSFIFERFPRLVRDLSKQLGKEIKLVMEGQDTELDRTLIDEIGEPMVHIIRNSIDHGIETPDERTAKNKNPEGIIKISAYQDGNGVIIETSDDGKGIDASKVRAKALATGLISEEKSQRMNDEEVVNLIFEPGFSLAEKVTSISGRGVGMDAVKNKVESLGGKFDISSELGKGTKVFVRLPLTLAIVLSLLVRVEDEIFAIPLENVEETILISEKDIQNVHGVSVTLLRDHMLTLCDLSSLLELPLSKGKRAEKRPVVVVKTGKSKIGFIVSKLIGQQDIVIKSIGNFLGKIEGIAGATILGDGNVAIILDVNGLVAKQKNNQGV